MSTIHQFISPRKNHHEALKSILEKDVERHSKTMLQALGPPSKLPLFDLNRRVTEETEDALLSLLPPVHKESEFELY